eukprot:364352-Chlamydomonas_euryale.AAC.5
MAQQRGSSHSRQHGEGRAAIMHGNSRERPPAAMHSRIRKNQVLTCMASEGRPAAAMHGTSREGLVMQGSSRKGCSHAWRLHGRTSC